MNVCNVFNFLKSALCMEEWLGKGKLRQIMCLIMRMILEATILLNFDHQFGGGGVFIRGIDICCGENNQTIRWWSGFEVCSSIELGFLVKWLGLSLAYDSLCDTLEGLQVGVCYACSDVRESILPHLLRVQSKPFSICTWIKSKRGCIILLKRLLNHYVD